MKKLLFLLIASSSISLMGMENQKQIIPLGTAPLGDNQQELTPPPFSAPPTYTPSAPTMEQREQTNRASRCLRESKDCACTLACCVAMPVTLITDCVSCPCQCCKVADGLFVNSAPDSCCCLFPCYATGYVYTQWKKNIFGTDK
jgi:hypothetical protein